MKYAVRVLAGGAFIHKDYAASLWVILRSLKCCDPLFLVREMVLFLARVGWAKLGALFSGRVRSQRLGGLSSAGEEEV